VVETLRAAPHIVHIERAPVLAAARAGRRIVALGDYGVTILSDDGKTFRQAREMPTRAVLTSLFFLDDKRGWAAGHDGTVVATADGGETWRVLREERGKERALLSVWFENENHGIAVGQFGLMLETDDAGKTWRERKIVEGGEAGDRHLYAIFSGGEGLVFVAAESGAIFRSADLGRNWKLVQTTNKGSFWTGARLKDGSLLVAGMRGHIFRSEDKGLKWSEIPSGTLQSLTGIVQHFDGSVSLIGMSGVMLARKSQALSFEPTLRADRSNLTAAVAGDGAPDVLFSLGGLLSAQ
jgi:photosystem II stability/assembly factor-like uncharacterized protein